MSLINAPIITILGNVESRTITVKGFPKAVHGQLASVETEQMRMQIEIEHDDPNKGYKIGEKFYWDVSADLVPGQFGRMELARKKTLRPLLAEAKSTPAKAA
jgi:hypothetical protein